MSEQLSAFLEWLWEPPGSAIHDTVMDEKFGPDLVAALLSAGILVRGEEATWMPCTMSGPSCPRVVVRDVFKDSPKPHSALCRDQECDRLAVGPEDLRTSSVAIPALLSLVQQLMRLPRAEVQPDQVLDCAWTLGAQQTATRERRVIAILKPATHSLRWYLADIRARYRAALVLLPQAKWASGDLVQAHAPGADVELAFLEDRLRFESGHLRWAEPEPHTGDPASTAEAPKFALAFDGKRRFLTRVQYERELDRVGKDHVFIDIVVPKGRKFRAGRKDRAGKYKEVWMPQGLAELLARAVIKQRPVLASELGSAQSDLGRMLRRAQQYLDVSVSRFERTYFHTQRGESKADKAFVFRPPPGATYLLLCPPTFGE